MNELTRNGDVAQLVLNDEKANAVGHELIDTVESALDASRDAKALVITGRPGMFSAGFDLKEFEKGPDATQALVDRGARMLLAMFVHPRPVVIACSGHAVAAGALMLLAADTRIGATGEFKLGLNETAIGMGLPTFGLELAHARLSKRHLTPAVIQSRLYDPQGAVDAGFLDEVVPGETLLERANDVASELAELPGEAYAANKAALRRRFAAAIEASLS